MSLKKLTKQLNVLLKTNKLQLSIATTMQAETARRIFENGQAADSSQIGTYSEGYLKTRQKDGYPPSDKVILQATRQMVNDWSVISNGSSVGLGFKNKFNADKSVWVEDTYDKSIFAHTETELRTIDELSQDFLDKLFRG